jgi:hypothetical protein
MIKPPFSPTISSFRSLGFNHYYWYTTYICIFFLFFSLIRSSTIIDRNQPVTRWIEGKGCSFVGAWTADSGSICQIRRISR